MKLPALPALKRRSTLSPVFVWAEDDRVLVLQADEAGPAPRVVAHGSAPIAEEGDRDAALARAVREALRSSGARGDEAAAAVGPDDVTVCHVRIAAGEGPGAAGGAAAEEARVREALAQRLGHPAEGLRLLWSVAGEVPGGERRREICCVAIEGARLDAWTGALRKGGPFPESAVLVTEALRAIGRGRPCLWVGKRRALFLVFAEGRLVFGRDLAAGFSAPEPVPADALVPELKASLRHAQLLQRHPVSGPLVLAGPRAADVAETLSRDAGIEVALPELPEGWGLPPEVLLPAAFAADWATGLGLLLHRREGGEGGELLPRHLRHARELRASAAIWAAVLAVALGLCTAFFMRARALRDYIVSQQDETRSQLANLRVAVAEMQKAREDLAALEASAAVLEERLLPPAGFADALAAVCAAAPRPVALRSLALGRPDDGPGLKVELEAEGLTADHPQAFASALHPLARGGIEGPRVVTTTPTRVFRIALAAAPAEGERAPAPGGKP